MSVWVMCSHFKLNICAFLLECETPIQYDDEVCYLGWMQMFMCEFRALTGGLNMGDPQGLVLGP